MKLVSIFELISDKCLLKVTLIKSQSWNINYNRKPHHLQSGKLSRGLKTKQLVSSVN